MRSAQSRDLGGERGVEGLEIEPPSIGDFLSVGRFALAIKRLAVEGRRRAEFGRRLAGIERRAARIAVDVDQRARQRGPDNRRAERAGEIVELGDVPIRVAARQPWAGETRLAAVEVEPGVGNATISGASSGSTTSQSGASLIGSPMRAPAAALSPTAATIAPPRTSAVAAAMSGCRRAIGFEPRDVVSQPRHRRLERRAGGRRPMELAGLRRGEQFDSDHRGSVLGFKKIWPDFWGRLEHILRHSIFTLLEYPGATLLDLPRLLTNKDFRTWC